MPDWGLGRYELTAAELEPVARRVVAMANPLRGERVLDIACGTGNAAILAARFGAKVTGVDLAPRLVLVARRRAESENLPASFNVGDAEDLQFADASFEVVVSVFGLIFAPDRRNTFSEFVRVMRPMGRGFFTVWLPGGPIGQMIGMFSQAMNDATGASPPAPAFEWHDAEAIRALAAEHSTKASFHGGELQFSAPSVEEYLNSKMHNDPMMVAMRPVLEEAGLMDDLTRRALEILREGNEDPAGFRVTSRYRIVEIRRTEPEA